MKKKKEVKYNFTWNWRKFLIGFAFMKMNSLGITAYTTHLGFGSITITSEEV